MPKNSARRRRLLAAKNERKVSTEDQYQQLKAALVFAGRHLIRRKLADFLAFRFLRSFS